MSRKSKPWGVFEFQTGVLWSINPQTKKEAKKVAKDFSKEFGYHIAVPVKWGEHMRNASAHGRSRGIRESKLV